MSLEDIDNWRHAVEINCKMNLLSRHFIYLVSYIYTNMFIFRYTYKLLKKKDTEYKILYISLFLSAHTKTG